MDTDADLMVSAPADIHIGIPSFNKTSSIYTFNLSLSISLKPSNPRS